MEQVAETTTILDGIALLVVLGLGVLGAIKGAMRFVIGLVAVSAGVSLAAAYGGSIGAHTWPLVADAEDPAAAGTLAGGAVIFVAALLLGAVLAKLLRAALEQVALGGVDRFLGFLLGATKGALFVILGVFVLLLVDVPSIRESLDASHTLALTKEVALVARGSVPEQTRDLIDEVFELREDPKLRR